MWASAFETSDYSSSIGNRTADVKMSYFSERKLMGACPKDSGQLEGAVPVYKADSMTNKMIKVRNELSATGG